MCVTGCRDHGRTADKFVRVSYALLQQQAHLILGWDGLQMDKLGMTTLFR